MSFFPFLFSKGCCLQLCGKRSDCSKKRIAQENNQWETCATRALIKTRIVPPCWSRLAAPFFFFSLIHLWTIWLTAVKKNWLAVSCRVCVCVGKYGSWRGVEISRVLHHPWVKYNNPSREKKRTCRTRLQSSACDSWLLVASPWRRARKKMAGENYENWLICGWSGAGGDGRPAQKTPLKTVDWQLVMIIFVS